MIPAGLSHICWYLLRAGDVLLTVSATPLQTLLLVYEVVLAAQTPSEMEEFTAHGRGVVEVTLERPKAGSRVRSRFTGL